ncbi:unnamed protein product [Caenorhabditis auriculariae]|uniref:Uncharacterized protein n=1 Tax=Caenorhabditis auriculariae TaxID=2777116 RepID=A0A8S1HA63_9PELO|nr:unnamed protein product [Caenorhabditis auriculariae]
MDKAMKDTRDILRKKIEKESPPSIPCEKPKSGVRRFIDDYRPSRRIALQDSEQFEKDEKPVTKDKPNWMKRFLKDERKQEKLPRNPATTRDSNEAMAEAQSLPSEAINLPSWTSYKEEATVSQTESLSAMRPPRPPPTTRRLETTQRRLSSVGKMINQRRPQVNETLKSSRKRQLTDFSPEFSSKPSFTRADGEKTPDAGASFPFQLTKAAATAQEKRQNSDEVPPTLISIDCTPPVPTMRSYFSKIEPLQSQKAGVGIVLEDVDPRRRATSQKMNGSMTSTTTTTSTASQNQEYIVVNNVTNFAVEPDRATYAPPSLGP